MNVFLFFLLVVSSSSFFLRFYFFVVCLFFFCFFLFLSCFFLVSSCFFFFFFLVSRFFRFVFLSSSSFSCCTLRRIVVEAGTYVQQFPKHNVNHLVTWLPSSVLVFPSYLSCIFLRPPGGHEFTYLGQNTASESTSIINFYLETLRCYRCQ